MKQTSRRRMTKRKCDNPKFVVIVCCQGQPFYYEYSTVFGACCGFAYQYLTNKKYGTMNFSLKEVEND